VTSLEQQLVLDRPATVVSACNKNSGEGSRPLDSTRTK
jgi:hypothetical protein